ncbi:hypothetical protein CANCADRAFT_47375 [Tortispora caseinolytica NRRL Y-17796]|uniref:Protein transport protein SEC23 n=1 Tax=Tortispora caseinolytica NRRL Y-17796 TaxID=767744 RepID=A0A1E4TJX3_9ASCO|nr:hypothetical protein CANCADRAFT_47375 [Tortispora caseinolytica NRRL Y-17796]
MDFEEYEDKDGVRFSWNVFPSTRIEANRSVVPIGAMFTPLHERPDLPILDYEPVACKPPCSAILNPFCTVDIRSNSWTCPFCLNRNPLPPQYKNFTPAALPLEVAPQNTSVEYLLSRPVSTPPIFFFIVDTCQPADTLMALKQSIIVSLNLLPENALVGLMTFGTMCHLYELGYSVCKKSYVFRGNKDYTVKQVQDILGLMAPTLRGTGAPRPQQISASAMRFVQPLQNCEFQLINILEELQPDSWPVKGDHRALRCTGVAMNVAISFMETSFQDCPGHILLFAGGPATQGPGQVVGPELREPIRSHHDIDRGNAKHYKKACKFYEGLARRSALAGHAVDIFAGCYDQIGMAEMKYLASSTGGCLVLTDSFSSSLFKQSFLRLFDKDPNGDLNMAFLANMEVITSKDIKIQGILGNVFSLNKKTAQVSESEVGIGGTRAWRMCGITPTMTYATFFEVVSQSAGQSGNAPPNALIQYITTYIHSSGQFRLRVTTLARAMSPGGDPSIALSFDQEAAATLLARLAVFKAETDDHNDVLRWVDRMLIRVCQKYADYRKDDVASFSLSPGFRLFPQFIYHLRRSQFLQVFNNSPDETAFYRHVLYREDVGNSLIMIQPTLTCFSTDKPPMPVLLDTVSIKPDVILLLDTFFHILIFHGELIAQWRKAGYQDQEEYEYLRELLQAPRVEAAELLVNRFPLPRFVVTDAGGSQARFLLSKLNPSTSEESNNRFGSTMGTSTYVHTDDVSLQTFMSHLEKLAVSGSS